ncbi:MAG: PrsW family intramembrane metalloprotease [bacterium]|nr:PrsW family intramembrane metalloprotease [bacterium]
MILNLSIGNLIKLYSVSALVSLFFIILWILFFYVYSPKKTIRIKFLLVAFILGISSAFLSLIVEMRLFNYFNIDTSFLDISFSAKTLSDLIGPLIYSFCFAAIIEETSKFILVKKLFDLTNINQVIDGMKIGLALGLGFALIENSIYFSAVITQTSDKIAAVFILRGVLSTLAHGIYGIVMGYYLSLAKFYEKLHTHFVWRALIASFLIHGLFNFFLIIQLGFYSLFMLVFLLVAAVLWYNDRKNLELRITMGDKTLVVPPFLAEKLEFDIWKGKKVSREDYLEKLWNILLETDERKNEHINKNKED